MMKLAAPTCRPQTRVSAGQHLGLFALTKSIWSVRFLNLELGHLHHADRGAMRQVYHVSPQQLSTM
jgi:hypothetical protein